MILRFGRNRPGFREKNGKARSKAGRGSAAERQTRLRIDQNIPELSLVRPKLVEILQNWSKSRQMAKFARTYHSGKRWSKSRQIGRSCARTEEKNQGWPESPQNPQACPKLVKFALDAVKCRPNQPILCPDGHAEVEFLAPDCGPQKM